MDKNEVFNGNTVRLIPLWKWLLAEENLPVGQVQADAIASPSNRLGLK